MTARAEATILFRGGTVFDGHRYLGSADVLIQGDRILAVGPAASAARGCTVVDVDGALLAPGFVDAHVHTVQGGLERIRCDLSHLGTRADYLAAIATYADNHDTAWILGGGWSMPAFPGGCPTATDLDRIVPDRPVFLLNRDHHGAWVNSRALAVAGITAGTPDPADGRIERDDTGRPTGTLHEGAMALVGRWTPATSPREYRQALLAGQEYLHSVGVTTWQDAILGAYAGMDDPSQTYRDAADAGELTGTVVGALWWERDRDAGQITDLVERRDRLSGGRLRTTSVKIMQDGVAENGTASMLTAYLDRCGHATGNHGHSFLTPEALRRAVRAAVAAGFQVHVHAIGDRGVREALDAFEAADSDPASRSLRHHIAHLQVVHPDDVPRFARLGVSATIQALWACRDDQMIELTEPLLGDERVGWQYPFGDLHRSGASLAAGSDWPVSSPDPLAAIHTAVNRTAYGEPGPAGSDPLGPEQALDLSTAFAAYTSGSARICGRDDAGVIAPGAVADLVLLDRDPFAGPPSEIGGATAVATWIDGRPVAGPHV